MKNVKYGSLNNKYEKCKFPHKKFEYIKNIFNIMDVDWVDIVIKEYISNKKYYKNLILTNSFILLDIYNYIENKLNNPKRIYIP